MTAGKLEGSIRGPQDLPKVRFGVIEKSAAQIYCQKRALRCISFADTDALLTALSHKKVDAAVHEAPLVQYAVARRFADSLEVLPGTFDNHGYGFALKTGSPYREAINNALLTYVESEDFAVMRDGTLGGR
jgi:ABC-type amino acid transport substrate-binding protein